MSNIDMLRGIDSGFISRYGQEVLSNADMLRVIDSGFIRRYGQEVLSNTDIARCITLGDMDMSNTDLFTSKSRKHSSGTVMRNMNLGSSQYHRPRYGSRRDMGRR